MADRLRARCRQLGLNARQVAELARVNRSFVYDIMRGRSENPNLERLQKVAEVLKVERDWLLHGLGRVEGEPPIFEHPDEVFVAIPSVEVRASMGGGNVVEDGVEKGEPYHFRRAWIRDELGSAPENLRILHVEGDSMEPTLLDGDVVLVDLTRRAPTPPGVFVLFDGIGLVAKRIEHLPSSDPPTLRILSDNPRYSTYERTAEEVNVVGRLRWLGRGL